MAYSNFNLQSFITKFGLSRSKKELFVNIKPVLPGNLLKEMLASLDSSMLISEKARSESIIYPILLDVYLRNKKSFGLYSGATLNANIEEGLAGECDFILAKDIDGFILEKPVFGLVEAKKDDINDYALGQCAAQMYGAKLINERNSSQINIIYGCVTTGEIWQFMKLEDNIVYIDEKRYYIDRVELILGVLQAIVSEFV